MKNILYAIILLILFRAGVAQAEWTEDFTDDFDEFGMSIAVENALNDDITPREILTYLISNSEQFEMRRGLKALYCAGVDRNTVREAADKLGITVEKVSTALEESIEECGNKMSLSDRDLFDGGAGNDPGLSDRDIAPPPEIVPPPVQEEEIDLPEQITLPAPPPAASPSAP